MTPAAIVWTVAVIGCVPLIFYYADALIDRIARKRADRQIARDAEETCCTCDCPPRIES